MWTSKNLIGMSGIEATKVLKTKLPETYPFEPWITALTANSLDRDQKECIGAGMNDFISKPFKLESLKCSLDNAARHVSSFKPTTE